METTQSLENNHQSPEASKLYGPRSLAGLMAILAVMLVLQILRTNSEEPMSMWICGFISIPATLAGLSMWFAFKGHNTISRARMKCALIAGLIAGGIAFIGGVVGPLLFMRESNVGPIIGFIITGPIGFLAGNVLGAIYSFLKPRKQKLS